MAVFHAFRTASRFAVENAVAPVMKLSRPVLANVVTTRDTSNVDISLLNAAQPWNMYPMFVTAAVLKFATL